MINSNEDHVPEYSPFYTLSEVYQPTDNILIRALRYLPTRIIRNAVKYMLNKESNKIRSKYGLTPNSLSRLESFVILESFYGLQFPMLLPSNIEHVGFLSNPRFHNTLDPEIKD